MFSLILFDVDGVLLSEERYFDATALTVWELLYSPNYLNLSGDRFDPRPNERKIREIRREVFANDRILDFMKSRGINSNWDMVYLSFAHQLLCLLEQALPDHRSEAIEIASRPIGPESFSRIARLFNETRPQVDFERFLIDYADTTVEKQALLTHLNELARSKLGVETNSFYAASPLWQRCYETFQEWYLGDDLVADDIGRPSAQPGKTGFLNDEIPIVPPKEMAATFSTLREKGIALGIGTGRPAIETVIPLREMELLDYFDSDRIITASDVLEAEERYPDYAPLSKPQPFCYIKGWLGKQASVPECVELPLPVEGAEKLLIVGDSVADLMAAQSIGCRFAAVLTGLSGQDARDEFEELGADYILKDAREVVRLVDGN